MPEQYQLSSNRLKIANRERLFGLMQLSYAVFVGLAVAAGLVLLPGVVFKLDQFVEAIDRQESGVAEAFALLPYVATAAGMLLGSLIVLVQLVGGLRRMVSIFIPVKVPQDLYLGVQGNRGNQATVYQDLFKHRTISVYRLLPGFVGRVAQLVSSRLRYATPPMYDTIKLFLGVWAIVFTLLLCLPIVLALPPIRSSIESAINDPEVSKHLVSVTLPWLLIAVVVLGRVIRLLMLVTMMPATPTVQVDERRLHLENTGNPVNFFNHTTDALESLRVADFPTRMYRVVRPKIGTARAGETVQFGGYILCETQPWPMKSGGTLPCVIAGLGGALVGTLGIAALTTLPINPLFQFSLYDAMLWGLGALAAIILGMRLMRESKSLQLVYRFRSVLLLINLNGTYTSSEIGLGDGRGGQLHARRSAMQSDTYVAMYASSLVTECFGPRALQEQQRYIVSAEDNPELKQMVDTLVTQFEGYADSGASLPGVRIDAAAQQMIQVNSMIVEANAAAKNRPKQVGANPQPPPPRIDGQSSDALAPDEPEAG